jgi:hypothetical protein
VAANGLAHSLRVTDVAGDDVDVVLTTSEITRRAVGLVVHIGADIRPGSEQVVDQRAPDEPLSPGDQDLAPGPRCRH